MDRREFLKRVSLAGLGASFFSGSLLKGFKMDSLFAAPALQGPMDMAVVKGANPSTIVKKAVDALGGMKRFISRGDVVMLKPNLGWARTPEQAANTNPDVLKTVIELCFDAGAKTVKITDNTCNDPRQTFSLSGAMAAAKEAGAKIFYSEDRFYRDMKVGGGILSNWPVNKEIVEADKLINIPIAKHHCLSKLTLGMKNWFGAVGGDRGRLHQDINHTVADLAGFFKPNLTIVDAVRILTANGPTGGNLNDVKKKDTVIATTDVVAADSYAATFFGMTGADLGYVGIAEKMGLGTADYQKLKFVSLSA